MHLRPGQKLTFYEITGELGRGGMGEVYRARDTRLDRDVALKLLPPTFVENDESLRRFEREAKLLAALNHPNVAAIYDIAQAEDDSCFLALELVPGESLADRLRAGPLSLEAALTLADQIAAGLEAAHGKGIVHRDLKPANVMITPEGTAKLLDFGLAKVADPESAGAPAPETEALTEPGRVFGTPNYMSPEQVDGAESRATSDAWAFGCVLYEMLAGERAFSGPSLTAVLARVTTGEPDWSKLPAATPAHIVELMRRCLRRDPGERPPTIGDVRGELVVGDGNARPRATWHAALVALAVIVPLALLFVFLREQDEPEPAEPRTLQVSGLEVAPHHRPLLSPDGSLVVLRAAGELQVHDPKTGTTLSLPRTAQATHPFWSPDSSSVGFRREGALLALDLATDAERLLTRLGDEWQAGGGAAWGDDGAVVFTAGGDGSPLYRLMPNSSDPDVWLRPSAVAGVRHFHDPAPLGGGAVLVVAHREGNAPDALGVVTDGTFRELVRCAGDELARPTWSPSGHVLFERVPAEAELRAGIWALSLDPEDLAPLADPFPVAPDCSPAGAGSGGRRLRLSPLVGREELVWIDTSGRTEPAGVKARGLRAPDLSPNGDRVALSCDGPDGTELRVHDLDTGRGRLLGPAPAGSTSWSARGTQLACTDPGGMIRLRDTFGATESRELVPGHDPELSANGFLVYADAAGELWSLQLGASAPERLTRTQEPESEPRLSPGGRYLAFVREQNGSPTVRVAPFPPGELSWQVSGGTGSHPRWSGTGELFFVRDGRLFAVPVRLDGAFDYDAPRELVPGSGLAFERGFAYDGQAKRFLAVRSGPGAGRAPSLVLVEGDVEPLRAEDQVADRASRETGDSQ